jgi:hypothetical protein
MRRQLHEASEIAYAQGATPETALGFTRTLALSGFPHPLLEALGREMRLATLLAQEFETLQAASLCARLTEQAIQSGPDACRGLAHLFMGVLVTTARLAAPRRTRRPALTAVAALVESLSTLRKALPADEALRLKQRVKATLSAA